MWGKILALLVFKPTQTHTIDTMITVAMKATLLLWGMLWLTLFSPTHWLPTAAAQCPMTNQPANLSTTATTARLQWATVAGASRYRIDYRAENGTIRQIESPVNSVLLTELAPNTAYTATVSAVCWNGFVSGASPVLSFRTTVDNSGASGSCPVAQNVSTTPGGLNRVFITWSAVTGAQRYIVQYRPVGGNWIAIEASAPALVLNDLIGNTTYEARVMTQCWSGFTADWSATVRFTVTGANGGGAGSCQLPSNVTIQFSNVNVAVLNWPAVAGASRYRIQYRPAFTAAWNTLDISSPIATLTDLVPGQSYDYRIQTVCWNGFESAYSPEQRFSVSGVGNGTVGTCTTPTGLLTSSATTSSLLLSWQAVVGAQQYNIQYRALNSGPNWMSINSSTSSANVIGLSPGTQYELRVRTQCWNGFNSDWTNTLTASTVAALGGGQSVCVPPTRLVATNVSVNTAMLSWAATAGAPFYFIEYRTGNLPWTRMVATTNSFMLTGLAPVSTYEVRVQVVCWNTLTSGYSDAITFRTGGEGTGTAANCETPTNVQATVVGINSILVSWSGVRGADRYTVQYRSAGRDWQSVEASGLSTTIPNLMTNTSYDIQVRTQCWNGFPSAFSTPITVRTQGDSNGNANPCPPPANLTATMTAVNTALVSWTVTPGVERYMVQYRVQGAVTWQNLETRGGSLFLNSLQTGSAYEIRIMAFCWNGFESSFSSSIVLNTINGANPQTSSCQAPDNLRANNVVFTTARITWNPIAGIQKYILSYRNIASPTSIQVETMTNVVILNNLVSGTTYIAQVRAECWNGFVSEFTAPIVFNMQAGRTDIAPANNDPFAISIFPNPSKGRLSVVLGSAVEAHDAQITITDLAGRVAIRERYTLQAGESSIPIQAEGLAAGIYALHFQSGSIQRTVKFRIED
jgi:hypothetical protein